MISVCSSLDSSRATQALQRLLDNADTISNIVDLAGVPIHPAQTDFWGSGEAAAGVGAPSLLCVVRLLLIMPGASIAIDDCYELWESGFVSIPYNFELRELQPQLQKLLQGSATESQEGATNEARPDLYPDAEAAVPESSSDEWKHSRYYLDDAPAMDGSASAITAATMTAEALAGVPTDPPFSSNHYSGISESAEPGDWPLRMAAAAPQAHCAVQSQIVCRPGRAFRKHEALSVQARRWRGTYMRCPEIACQSHSKARWATLK